MPYIQQETRVHFDADILKISDTLKHEFSAASKPGILNYIITKLLLQSFPEPRTYRDHSEMLVALECAKLELYRKFTAPYEDRKAAENGELE